ncbi:hypothetical protein BIV25_38615 [Streptomyces sp. MUSC 14]|uniref:hypothetical protein n=1 Tax=Streptomyces sp. MUSC 14 TaxID=1354889 RepID=UPI0008F57DCD|nr:hypothetical protein [Streptomyces sp. MUSC 14]OIJ87599.1 hypothetical protein BIV25_38615 [Streptomyces sp. MUSC 14]
MPRKPRLLILPILEGSHELVITRLKHVADSFTLHHRITPPPTGGSPWSVTAPACRPATRRPRTTPTG